MLAWKVAGAAVFGAFVLSGPLQHVGLIPVTAVGDASKAALKMARDTVIGPAWGHCHAGGGNVSNPGGGNPFVPGGGNGGNGGGGNGGGGNPPTRGNNGVGNGIDPQPPGNPPINDGPGTGPGNPGNRGGA